MFKIIKRRKIWFLVSGLLMVGSILSLIFFGLNVGIDFKGGTEMELELDKGQFDKVKSEQILEKEEVRDIVVQLSGEHGVLLKFDHIDKEKHAAILEDFQTEFKGAKETRYETVGPTVSQDLTRKAFIAVAVASLGIIFYLSFAFRKVTKPANPWKFGVCAVIALVHDSLFVVGMFALLGHFFDLEVNSLFITALLTVIGFSVHDTIVVFDRIRENLNRMDKPFEDVVEYSVGQTMVRSLATSFTTLLVLVAIILFGGETIRSFIFALAIGIIVGVYSSIFLASPLIVAWQSKGND
ncbi:protein translocase subunit SecF [Patescibacteria group bacterium]|nr:MAG: protein translocase subunit SecF [Patescibacteria group bacterium]